MLLILALFVTGLLGPAPAVPMSPLMTVNVQLGLFILLAFQLQLQAPTSQVSKSLLNHTIISIKLKNCYIYAVNFKLRTNPTQTDFFYLLIVNKVFGKKYLILSFFLCVPVVYLNLNV